MATRIEKGFRAAGDQQHEGEFKQEFLEAYRKQYGESGITADQTWELYTSAREQRRGKKTEGGQIGEQQQKQIFEELHADFKKDYTAAHGNNKVNDDQAWALVQDIIRNKRKKWPKH
ncbi:unnamed protein product [Adineta steineri]|uniref:Uncharacterized protein n=1 Tax=Adineta steineri TaxID=433720 RepID=A0A815F609_9BILA|nr:unnamed protein product [Adineta steineri]